MLARPPDLSQSRSLGFNQKDRGLWKRIEILEEFPSGCSQW